MVRVLGALGAVFLLFSGPAAAQTSGWGNAEDAVGPGSILAGTGHGAEMFAVICVREGDIPIMGIGRGLVGDVPPEDPVTLTIDGKPEHILRASDKNERFLWFPLPPKARLLGELQSGNRVTITPKAGEGRTLGLSGSSRALAPVMAACTGEEAARRMEEARAAAEAQAAANAAANAGAPNGGASEGVTSEGVTSGVMPLSENMVPVIDVDEFRVDVPRGWCRESARARLNIKTPDSLGLETANQVLGGVSVMLGFLCPEAKLVAISIHDHEGKAVGNLTLTNPDLWRRATGAAEGAKTP